MMCVTNPDSSVDSLLEAFSLFVTLRRHNNHYHYQPQLEKQHCCDGEKSEKELEPIHCIRKEEEKKIIKTLRRKLKREDV